MTADEMTIEVGPRNTGWLFCPTRVGKKVLSELGIPHLWDHEQRTWSFPVQHAETIAAHQHRRGQYVAIVAVDR